MHHRGVLDPRRDPSGAILDSQAVKGTGLERGYNGAKRLVGRKRHLLVDTKGWYLALAFTRLSCTFGTAARCRLHRAIPGVG